MVYFIELEIENLVYSNVMHILSDMQQISVKGATVTEITNTTGKQTYNAWNYTMQTWFKKKKKSLKKNKNPEKVLVHYLVIYRHFPKTQAMCNKKKKNQYIKTPSYSYFHIDKFICGSFWGLKINMPPVNFRMYFCKN